MALKWFNKSSVVVVVVFRFHCYVEFICKLTRWNCKSQYYPFATYDYWL